MTAQRTEADVFYNGHEPNDAEVNTSGLQIYDDRILVKIHELEEVTSGGIILPEEHREKQNMSQDYATVITVGRYAFNDMAEEHRPQSGEEVLISKYAGTFVVGPADNKEYRIVRPDDVLAKVTSKGDAS